MRPTTTRHALTWRSRKMRHCAGRSSGVDTSSPSQSCPDYTINMCGCDFRNGQVSRGPRARIFSIDRCGQTAELPRFRTLGQAGAKRRFHLAFELSRELHGLAPKLLGEKSLQVASRLDFVAYSKGNLLTNHGAEAQHGRKAWIQASVYATETDIRSALI